MCCTLSRFERSLHCFAPPPPPPPPLPVPLDQVVIGDKVVLTPVNANTPLHVSDATLLDHPDCREVRLAVCRRDLGVEGCLAHVLWPWRTVLHAFVRCATYTVLLLLLCTSVHHVMGGL